ncbi:MAG: LytR cell envelope-related transcriptional attenuator [Actinomycetota bacterium]
MKRGRHAADDGSFARSVGVNAGRGAVLIVAALVIGFLLLNDLDNGGDLSGGSVSAGRSEETTPTTERVLPTIATTTTAPVKAAKDVKVLVINGTTTAGAAARVATALKGGGYNVLRAVDASAQVKAATSKSAVYYVTRDFEREAKAIQAALALPPSPVTAVPTPPPAPEVNQANVVVVVGPELAKSGGSATTTTARGGSTATTRATTTTTR